MAIEELGLRVLGPLEVWSGEHRVRLGGPLAERVLTRLLLEPRRVVSVDALVEAVWDTAPPATAEHQVRKAASGLRQRIPDGHAVIVTDGSGYRTCVRDEQLDLTTFRQHLDRASAASGHGRHAEAAAELRAAVQLWRGPIEVGPGESLGPLSAALDERYLAAVEQLADLRIQLGESADVVGDLRRLVAAQPLRERLQGLFMTALAGTGRQAEALAVYAEVRRTLADELGIDPGPELTRLHETILRNEPVAVARRPATRTLPPDLSDFVGRDAELARIRAVAGEPATYGPRIVELDGMPGIGKTVLAVRAAHELAGRFPDGQFYFDLRDRPAARSPAGRVLVVLDNAENTARTRALMPVDAGSLAIVAGRVKLGLDGARSITVGPLPRWAARSLARQVLESQADPDGVDELIELCGGLPLAVRLILLRLRSRNWPAAEVVSRLRDDDRLLMEARFGDRSVAGSLRQAYCALEVTQQRVLRELGRLPDGDPAVHGFDGDVLDGLVDANLLEQRGVGRYALHKLVRAFVRTLGRQS